MTRFASALLILLIAGFSAVAVAQKKDKAPTERSVTGVVTDNTGSPVPGAVVQLENMKTLQVRSFIAKEKGDFYFNGLGTDVDYQLKAQSNGRESGTRTLSSFDTKAVAIIHLQLK